MDIEAPVNVDLRRRVGIAWRELRRGAATVRVRELFYSADDSSGDHTLDMALADALGVVYQQGPLRMGELAEALHITPASTTRAVTCLVEKGYVRRVRDEQDQRSVQVEITALGQERYGHISARIQLGLTAIMLEFNHEEQEQLADYLERFVEAVGKLADSEPGDYRQKV